jgi:hypothetical protein
MAKLSDAIRAARRRGGRPMGFGHAASSDGAPKRGLLIAVVGPERQGADVHIVPDVAAVEAAVAAAGGRPIGVAAGAPTADDVAAAERAGAAFVVLDPATATADALFGDKIEYAFRLPRATTDEGALRALGSLQPALIVLDGVPHPLPVEEMLAIRRIVMQTGTPTAAPVAADASTSLCRALRDSGVSVLLLDAPSPAQVDALRERIASIPEPSRRGREAGPVVPGVAAAEFDDEMEESVGDAADA